jgi:hypothetical protein
LPFVDWQPEHEADRELRLSLDFVSRGALFIDGTDGFDGSNGREAFFAAAGEHCAGGKDEVKSDGEDGRRGDEEGSKHHRAVTAAASHNAEDGTDSMDVVAMTEEEKKKEAQ